MDQTPESAPAACPQCGKPIDTPTRKTITDRGWDPVRRKQYVRQREVTDEQPPSSSSAWISRPAQTAPPVFASTLTGDASP